MPSSLNDPLALRDELLECFQDMSDPFGSFVVVQGKEVLARGNNCPEAWNNYRFENAFSQYPEVVGAGPCCNLENPEICESCQ